MLRFHVVFMSQKSKLVLPISQNFKNIGIHTDSEWVNTIWFVRTSIDFCDLAHVKVRFIAIQWVEWWEFLPEVDISH